MPDPNAIGPIQMPSIHSVGDALGYGFYIVAAWLGVERAKLALMERRAKKKTAETGENTAIRRRASDDTLVILEKALVRIENKMDSAVTSLDHKIETAAGRLNEKLDDMADDFKQARADDRAEKDKLWDRATSNELKIAEIVGAERERERHTPLQPQQRRDRKE